MPINRYMGGNELKTVFRPSNLAIVQLKDSWLRVVIAGVRDAVAGTRYLLDSWGS